ncbi:putative peptidase S9, prolyl oligopeptidase, catalytic domain, six-bladed beta-propeller, TolB [Septoria linicola]|nr:putative peptidase S9, prolyl oligopeptidase, catalytic domain, six-bladed beta-propeller, TolB [Septoria linicola]
MVQRAMHFTPKVLLSAPRRSAGVPNSSGTHVLYTVSTYSFETHSKTNELRVLEVESGESHELAKEDDISDLNWLDDDNFTCLQAEKDGTTSLYVASVSKVIKDSNLGTSHYVAGTIDGPAGNLKIKKLDEDNYAVVFSAQAENRRGTIFNPESEKKPQSTARIYTTQFVRHWDSWTTKETNALWYAKLSRSGKGKLGLSNYTNGLLNSGLESPVRPFGGTDNFDISPQGIIFVAKDPVLNPALNTKENVYILHVHDWTGQKKPSLQQIIVPDFEGAAGFPVFNSDGTKAAFLMMKTRGYEADKNHIFVLHDIKDPSRSLERAFSSTTEGEWNRSPASLAWTIDDKQLLMTAEDVGTVKLYSIPASLKKQEPKVLTKHGSIGDVRPLADGRIFASGSSLVDNSIFLIIAPHLPAGQADTYISWTSSNSAGGTKLGGLKPSQVSSIWTPASNPKINQKIHSLVVRPSSFDSSRKYPVAYLIHGGPQSAWSDSFSTRWNPMVFAEAGYIVITPNPTGSTGYGQPLTDAIRHNWGGDPYQDIVNVFEWASRNIPEADHDRAVALGASYGGYMMNWIQGHDLGRKFKALVCHDGITSFAGGMLGTEELYFPFYDLGGTPWFDPGYKPASKDSSPSAQGLKNFGPTTLSDWRKWDPSEHFANWATPQLVIHSSKDYRLPIAEGLAAFNVLQARGVESKFLTFPDENHWVLKPENSLVWHKVVLNWINHYAGLPPYVDEEEDSIEFLGGVKDDKDELVEMAGQGRVE